MDCKNFYILCGLFVFGIIATAYSKPATTDADILQNDQNDDYEYEDRNLQADQVKPTASSLKTTMLPYFDTKIVHKFVKPGGNITLECPVKNLSDTNVILWFREENTITNNLNVLDNAYDVAKQNFSLIIKNATVLIEGNYYCEIAPQKIRMQTILKVSNETSQAIESASDHTKVEEQVTQTTPGGCAPEVSGFVSLVLVSLLMSNLLSHEKYFKTLLNN
ncbi:uncharacterized protein LOC129907422 [Episyrphus balteatus]|uniref:uncharacterized protein LOC129907422 n=1 Tax=Episyrphus balteatus TaxID=286459 RepID=UPI002486506D|nr:uncharacterized protein LOC129907422 [Episyrphus balteatus]XP_055839604.1 uncharacterized protein LOC129907422 [Episyrphus balteatus]XP_055839605.1 uncharacterized protein LOC129907422 [Episyrphus balteatus]XP_055839606.1 uncharacterized protein LOC129907422 [Episyrphus balteatus]